MKPTVLTAAATLRAQAIKGKKCNTLQLREGCSMVDGQPNELLSQLLRVARVGCKEVGSPDPILWGVKCPCGSSPHHLPNCWKNVEKLYWFLQSKFMHHFTHQMWVEGAFNTMDLNQANTESKMCESKLLNKMNKISEKVTM